MKIRSGPPVEDKKVATKYLIISPCRDALTIFEFPGSRGHGIDFEGLDWSCAGSQSDRTATTDRLQHAGSSLACSPAVIFDWMHNSMYLPTLPASGLDVEQIQLFARILYN